MDRKAGHHRTGVRNKRGRCEIRYRINGVAHSEVLPIPYTQAGVIQAAKIRRERIDYHRHGIGELEQGNVPTFAELCQTWLDSHDQSAESRRTAKSRLNKHWMPELGLTRVDQIRYARLRQVMAEKRDLAAKTQRNLISAVRSVLDLAVQSDYITSNPAAQFPTIKRQPRAIDPFTRDERDRILAALNGTAKLFYAIRFYCGLRPGEVIALTWDDYDAKAAVLNVSKQTINGKHVPNTKTHQRRTVHVHPVVQALLREHPTRFAGGHILITRFGNAYDRPESFAEILTGWPAKKNREGLVVRPAVPGLLEKLSIRKRSPYNARHTCASMMLEAGADPAYCAKQLGHSTEMFFRVYAELINKDREAAERKKIEEYF